MGKHKYIETAEKLWELFTSYKVSVKDNPRTRREYVGKDGERVDTPLERPLTMAGFETYCYDMGITVHHYFDNPNGAYNEYRGICTRARRAIKADQIEGGMVGQYNHSITQRLNKLTEKTEADVTLKGQKIKVNFGSDDIHTPPQTEGDT